MTKNIYKIELYIYIDKEVILSQLEGENLEELKSKIIPTVKEECKVKGYTKRTVSVEYVIEKNEAYFDSDECFISLAD